MTALNIGSKVSFDSKRGRQIGRVIKLNTETVGIVTDDGRNWKVPPHLLSNVRDISEPNVIKFSSKRKSAIKKSGKRKNNLSFFARIFKLSWGATCKRAESNLDVYSTMFYLGDCFVLNRYEPL